MTSFTYCQVHVRRSF